MASARTSTRWTWSDIYQVYYRPFLNAADGRWHWETATAEQLTPRYLPPIPVDAANLVANQTDAVYMLTPQYTVTAPQGAQPIAQHQQYPNITPGTQLQNVQPSNFGSHRRYDRLDPTYYVRGGEFFRRGVMFSCLDVEPYTGSVPPENLPNPSFVTWVYLGEPVFSNIRRFVVIEENRGFCQALPISTYSQRATTKPGVQPGEHAIIYTSAQVPSLLAGEAGIYKAPIRVETPSQDIWLDPRSRINFNLNKPIQHNIRVKYLGRVVPGNMQDLLESWLEERRRHGSV